MKTKKTNKNTQRDRVHMDAIRFMTTDQLSAACDDPKNGRRAQLARAYRDGTDDQREALKRAHLDACVDIDETRLAGLAPDRKPSAAVTGAAALPDLIALAELTRRNVGSMLHNMRLDADRTERKSLQTWLGNANAALAKAGVF